MQDIQNVFNHFSNLKVAVVGDIMLDSYWFGTVDRISPEGPVPIVALTAKELRIGGAGNVALNIASLGARASLFSVIGNDPEGRALLSLIKKNHIDTKHLVKSNKRITTNKTRIISRNQQMMRLDSEVIQNISDEEEQELISNFRSFAEREAPAVVIFEDYNKGVLTANVIAEMLAVCKNLGIITTVDPKLKNFFSYKGVTIFKPNLAEVKQGLNLGPEETMETSLPDIHDRLNKALHHEISLITLSEKGIFFKHNNHSRIIPTHIRSVADVSGAGDTVIAVASLLYAATSDIDRAATVANIAGGLVCEEVGTVAINKEKLLQECISLFV